MNPDQPSTTKETVDNAQPSKEAAKGLTEEQKKQMEMQATQEHEQGSAKEKLAEQAQKLDQPA